MKPATKPNGNAMQLFQQKLSANNTQAYIRDALPRTIAKYMTPERMTKLALSVFGRTPALWRCTPESLVRCIVESASLGLDPSGGVLAQVYLVPYGNECQLVVAYQGLIELARRSGEFQTLEANAVYARDQLTLRYGFDAFFEHVPYMGPDDRGEFIGAYCVAKFKNGERTVCYMRKDDIEKRRKASQVGRNNKGPWAEWYEEMAIKSVIKKAAKMWPKTSDLADVMGKALTVDADGATPVPQEPLVVEAAEQPSRSDALADKIAGPPDASEEDDDAAAYARELNDLAQAEADASRGGG